MQNYYIKFDAEGNVVHRDVFPFPGAIGISKELFLQSAREQDKVWKLVNGEFVKTDIPPYIPPPLTADDIREQRAQAYRAESDPLKIEAEYDAEVYGEPVDYTAWIAKVREIKDRYPLPE